jgi:hypothetical protein
MHKVIYYAKCGYDEIIFWPEFKYELMVRIILKRIFRKWDRVHGLDFSGSE